MSKRIRKKKKEEDVTNIQEDVKNIQEDVTNIQESLKEVKDSLKEELNIEEVMKIARDFENDLGLSFEESYRLAEESLKGISIIDDKKIKSKVSNISTDLLFSSEEIKKLCTLDPNLQNEALHILHDEIFQYEQGSNAKPNMDYVIGLTIDRSNERKNKIKEQLKLLEQKRNEKKAEIIEEQTTLSIEERQRRIRESWNKQ